MWGFQHHLVNLRNGDAYPFRLNYFSFEEEDDARSLRMQGYGPSPVARDANFYLDDYI